MGKTWVATRALEQLRARGHRVAARKPAQSFAPGEGPTDAELLAAATGEAVDDVCPRHRWYPLAMAPPMAAQALGREPVRLADLVAEVRWPPGVTVGLVEGAGGLASPLAEDGDTASLARRLDADLLLLVAHAGLGTIHDVRLAVAALPPLRRPPLVLLNRYDDTDDLCRRNRAWLADVDGLAVVTGVPEVVEAIAAARAQGP